MLLRRKHLTPFEQVTARVEIITDRGVTHELVRHRLASFNQESTRYCNYGGKEMEFILPVEFYDVYDERQIHKNDCIYVKGVRELQESNINHNYCIWRDAMSRADTSYNRMLKMGSAPQLARAVLPNSLKTSLIVTANLREWLHIFKMRCASDSHPQIRELMINLREQFRSRIPVVFDEV